MPLPTGTNGIAPQLALFYDSRGRNGIVGTGWTLGGMSSIMRSGKDYFHDQANSPIQYGPGDRFVLDGQRLVLTSGSAYGAPESVYDTENASFATITAVGAFGNGPASFTMVTKDGITMEFGTNASTIRTTDNQEILAWRLSRVRDAYGNTVSYNYGDIDGEPLPLSISYASNTAQGLGAYCTVDFSYSYRADPSMTCFPRRTLFQRHLLDRITATVTALENGTVSSHVYRSLELKFALRDIGNSYLVEIKEYGRDNAVSMNSTAIQYGDQTVDWDILEGTGITIPFSEQSDLYMGDYDGDGLSDVMRAYYTFDSGGKRVTKLKIHPANGNPTWTYDLSNSPYYANLPNTGEYYQSFVSTDYNGDGKEDICIIHTQYLPGGSTVFPFILHKVQLLLSTATDDLGFSSVEYNAPDATFPRIKDPANSIQSGDFDGDGKNELIVHCVTPSAYTLYKLYMLKDGLWVNLPVPAGTDDNLKNPDRLMVVDVNGDRKHDLMVLLQPLNEWNSPYSCSVYSWNGTAMERISMSGVPSASTKSSVDNDLIFAVYPGDFNGDGNTDLLVNAALSSTVKWRIYFSNGTGYSGTYAPFAFSHLPAWPDDRFRIVVADINGDGRSDVLHAYISSYGYSHLDLYYSLGHTGAAPVFYTSYPTLATPLGTLFPCDQNGDGRVDIVSFTGWNVPLRTVLIAPDGRERLLCKVGNGFNAITEFHYASAPQALLNSTTDRSYPIIRTNLAMDLVDTWSIPDGVGGKITEVRKYYDAFVHVAGRGLIGFMITSGKDLGTGNEWNSWNSFDESYAIALPDHSNYFVAGLGPLGVTANSVKWTPLANTVSPGRFAIRMQKQVTYNVIANTSETTVNTYDAYGNVVNQSVSIGYGYPVTNLDVEVTTTTFAAFGPSPIPAKPTQINVQRTRTGSPTVSKATKLDYNAQGTMFRRTDFYGTPNWVKTEFTFNGLGLVSGKTVTSATSGTNGGQSETYLYDPTGRFVTTKKLKLVKRDL